VAPGTAPVTADNHGVKAFASYAIEDRAHQTITVTNRSGLPIAGPLYSAATGWRDSVWLWRKVPNLPGNPPLAIRLEPKDGYRIGPGERIRATLYFLINTGGVR
jgi:hypothetical protein